MLGALNSQSTKEIMDILEAVNQKGATMLLITHDIKVAARSERVLLMAHGRLADEKGLGKYTKDMQAEREQELTLWLGRWASHDEKKPKTKYLFRRPGENVLYMVSFWKKVQEQDGSEGYRFVILTTQANDSMKEDTGELSLFLDEAGKRNFIYSRMPIVLSADECRE